MGVAVVILLAAVIIFAATVRTSYYNSVTNILVTRADSSARLFRNYINTSAKEFYAGAARYAETFAEKEKLEFEVIGLDGRVIYSSSFSRLTGYEPGTPDVWDAILTEKTVSFSGEDSVTGQKVISASAPVYLSGGELVGAVRYVTGVELINGRITTLCIAAVAVAAGGLLLVIITGIYFLTSIITPLNRINSAAKTIASGRYGETIDYDREDEIGELVTSVNFMSQEIERSAKIKNEFISSVSHELRTPLTAIKGWAETMDSTNDMATLQKGTDVILQETDRLYAMVENLLDFSRLQNATFSLDKEKLDLVAEVYDAVIMYMPQAEKQGIEINFEEPEIFIPVMADKSRVRQVMINLIDNAIKYSENSSVVEVNISYNKDTATVEVKDYGKGIHPDDINKVKGKFYKGKGSKRGSGIGLALVSEIMQLHGGRFDIESEYGEYTSMQVTFKTVPALKGK